ncbi:hypothetical protein [Robertmurraya kyonggiensis]|uniref:Lipoprotein n=1 Tax=Robertmurraya kyonggiensis TaxID=1037680 RepID=A0A4U1DCK7_9BACI|nr:hypothetical protein [Robertmurraya kyonggiensis]TKC19803.1 hypothetical protein FA727_09785 [Robertmurraya kyonggiensis]
MRKTILFQIVVVCLVLLGCQKENVTARQSQENKEIENLVIQVQELQNEIKGLKESDNVEEATIVKEQIITTDEFPALSQAELTNLGFTGKVDDIKEDLIRHEDIIPYKGVLGGEMHFLNDEIIVLSHEWVFAPFDDGHTGGYLLLNFEIEGGKVTQWKVLDSYLYGENE